VHGFLRIAALNETALRLDYVSSDDGSVVDSVAIVQDLAQPW
jgi:hypothetical protein